MGMAPNEAYEARESQWLPHGMNTYDGRGLPPPPYEDKVNLGASEPFYEMADMPSQQRRRFDTVDSFQVGEIGMPPERQSGRSFGSKTDDEMNVVEKSWPLPPADEGHDNPEAPWPPAPEAVRDTTGPDPGHEGFEAPWPLLSPDHEVGDNEHPLGMRNPSYLEVVPGETNDNNFGEN